MMRTYVPAVPGESAISILKTVAQTTDSELARHLIAICERTCSPRIGSLPCGAKLFCQATEDAFGSPEHVLLTHTLAPLYLYGMPSTMQATAVAQLIDAPRHRTCWPRLPPFLECGNRSGLQCSGCARLAHEAHGRRVSYCAHCIHFVTRCPPLCQTSCRL